MLLAVPLGLKLYNKIHSISTIYRVYEILRVFLHRCSPLLDLMGDTGRVSIHNIILPGLLLLIPSTGGIVHAGTLLFRHGNLPKFILNLPRGIRCLVHKPASFSRCIAYYKLDCYVWQ